MLTPLMSTLNSLDRRQQGEMNIYLPLNWKGREQWGWGVIAWNDLATKLSRWLIPQMISSKPRWFNQITISMIKFTTCTQGNKQIFFSPDWEQSDKKYYQIIRELFTYCPTSEAICEIQFTVLPKKSSQNQRSIARTDEKMSNANVW